MKKETYKELSDQELADRLAQMKAEYRQLVATHAVSPIDNPAKIKADRRAIARVETEIRARQLAK